MENDKIPFLNRLFPKNQVLTESNLQQSEDLYDPYPVYTPDCILTLSLRRRFYILRTFRFPPFVDF